MRSFCIGRVGQMEQKRFNLVRRQINVIRTFIQEEGQEAGNVSAHMALEALGVIEEIIQITDGVSGLTEEEQAIVGHLVKAWDLYVALTKAERDRADLTAFQLSINNCQQIISHRIVRREYPEFWI